MKLKQSTDTKLKLSNTLRSWLPVLIANISDLEETIKPICEDNPLIEVKSGFEKSFQEQFSFKKLYKEQQYSSGTMIESMIIDTKSLYDELLGQIVPPLFPTTLSQNIAFEIIENLDENGYLDNDFETMANKLNTSIIEVEKIHSRFAYVEPFGIGSRDYKENFLFQLDASDIDESLYILCQKMIIDLDHLENFIEEENYLKALDIIKTFKN